MIMVDTKKLLPLGSIVILKDGEKKLMIDGIYLVDHGKTYDYGGILYPEGRLDDQVYLFDHDNIDQIVFRGFEDEERLEHLAKLKKWAQEEKQQPKKRLLFRKR